MNRTRFCPVPLILLLILLSAASSAQTESITRVENDLLPPVLVKGEKGMNILDRMKYYNIPGVSVAVFSGHKIQWAKGYGVMDAETGQPVTEKTLFVAGSISKPVAAAGALRLVQEGKLKLDENINAYLTSWKLPENEFTKTEKATLRRLLSHSAGVTVHGFRGYAVGEPLPSLIQILDGEKPANSAPIRVDMEPGTKWRYAGGGITVMQLALMDVEKRAFQDILRDKVLAPIGMRSSSYEQTLIGDRLKLAASGHYMNGKVIEGKRYIYPEMAAAGLWTTPTDLATFALEIGLSAQGKSNKVLSKDIARLMVTPQIAVQGTDEMALGFVLQHHGSQVYYGHGGKDIGFIAQLIAHRDDGYGAAIMTNSDGRSGELIDEILRSIANEYEWKEYLPKALEVVAVDRKTLEGYEGSYMVSSDNILRVQVSSDHLMAKETESDEFNLLPISTTEFIRKDANVRYVFGSRDQVTLRFPQREVTARRVSNDMKAPLDLLNEGKIPEAVESYRSLWKKDPKDAAVDEIRLNGLGYRFLGDMKLQEAVAVFKLNVELYPQSWNVYDSLGEGYMKNGEKDLAIKNYEKSLELNPQNANGAKYLEELKRK